VSVPRRRCRLVVKICSSQIKKRKKEEKKKSGGGGGGGGGRGGGAKEKKEEEEEKEKKKGKERAALFTILQGSRMHFGDSLLPSFSFLSSFSLFAGNNSGRTATTTCDSVEGRRATNRRGLSRYFTSNFRIALIIAQQPQSLYKRSVGNQ